MGPGVSSGAEMLEQFKLRLRDGTVLSVDHDGLRTWLLDDKVMVQPPGSSRWRPLRQLLAQESLDAQRAPAPAAPVPSAPEPAPEEEVIFFPPTGREESPLPVARTPLDEIAEPARPIVLSPAAEVAAPARPTVITPLAEAAVAPPREAGHAIPIIPLKRLDDEPPRARVDVEGPSLLDVARAAVERHGASDRPWQWAPPEPRPVVPAATAAPPSAPGREAAAETAEDLEEIDLVAEDELPHVPRPIGVPPAVNPLQVPPAVQAVVSRISGWIERLMRRARQLASPAPGKPRATSPEEIHPWAVALPPPPLSALPSLRLAPIDDDEAAPRPRRARLLGLARAWSKRAMLGAGALALLVVVASTSSTWMPRLWR